MMKIVKSLSIIMAVVAVVAGGTYAANIFTDSKTVNGNTFAAGDVEISLSRPGTTSFPFAITNWAPGDTTELILYIENEGNLAVKVPGLGSTVSGHWEGIGDGTLDEYVKLAKIEYQNGSAWTNVDLNDPNQKVVINPGATLVVKLSVKFDNTVNSNYRPINDYQEKVYKANFTIVAEQARNN